jgi:hypothetical protein
VGCVLGEVADIVVGADVAAGVVVRVLCLCLVDLTIVLVVEIHLEVFSYIDPVSFIYLHAECVLKDS